MLSPARKLEALRGLMAGLSAIVIPSTDPHSSEYTPNRDKRREFISNFTGSAGTCVVTKTEARLWTDGRYFTQAVQELDAAHWSLMKDRLPETPSVEDWLASVLTSSEGVVGVDPSNFPLNALRRLSSSLTAKGIRLCSTPDLVGSVWGGEQPPLASSPLAIHPIQYAGEEWGSKVARVCTALEALGADALCINALDEIAWLLNIRGSDVQHCPVALSYALVKKGGEVILCIDEGKLTPELRQHLSGGKVRLAPYHSIMDELRGLEGKVLVDPASINGSLYKALGEGGDAPSAAAASAAAASTTPAAADLSSTPFFNLYLPKSRVIEKPSPIPLLKSIKNAAELKGMLACHVRDGVTLCKFFSWLEGEVKAGRTLTEYEAAQRLDGMRRGTPGNKGLSFDTIMGWASNGAVIHYRPEKDTAKTITGSGLLLIDSGGQYEDGTTDVTRVLSFGEVTPHQKRAYTAVLQGHIALSSAKFPSGTGGVALDALARAPIWAQGLDYRHGTGHGVGAYLNVHEGPQGLANVARTDYAGGLVEHMTITDEPGYYEEGGFGIRIENVLYVKKAALPCSFGGDVWLEFKPFTCVPINTALVATGQLTATELAWLNEYNQWVRETLGPLLKEREEDKVALTWLLKETEKLAH